MSEHTAVVGRAATPPPPNVGSATLGEVLGLARDRTTYSGRDSLIGVLTTSARNHVRTAGYTVFPAVPGLFVEAVETFEPRAVVVEEAALRSGPWAGCLDTGAPELASQVDEALSRAEAKQLPVYWVSSSETAYQNPEKRQVPDGVLLIAPGSPLYVGTDEGAPCSVLVSVLRSLAH